MPGGTLTILYRPSSPVCTSRARPISAGPAISTVAPAICAPDESSTSPAITPELVPACPQADAPTNVHTISTFQRITVLLMILLRCRLTQLAKETCGNLYLHSGARQVQGSTELKIIVCNEDCRLILRDISARHDELHSVGQDPSLTLE